MLKRIIPLALALTLISGAVYAQGEVPKDFGGFYAGGDLNALSFENVSNGGTQTKLFTSDFGYSGHAGYGVQNATGLYYGTELSDGTREGVSRSNGVKDKFNNEFALDARIGQVVQDNLFYAKLGYANADVTEQGASSGSANYAGARLGAGVEHFVTNDITARAEVVYTDYQVRSINGNAVDPSNVVAKVGFSYLFH